MTSPNRREFLLHTATAAALAPLLVRRAAAADNAHPAPVNPFTFAPLGSFRAADDLGRRLQMNFDRLEQEKYWPENVFQREKEASNWPGDTEGRTVLALVLLAQATGRTPKHLKAILEKWPSEVNTRGYFGDIQPEGVISEQQLSGHGWALRALSELERWKPGGPAGALAKPIIENLILPTAGKHRDYPLDPAVRRAEGSYSGTHLGRVGSWLLSTDVGCDFICLDGVVDAYEAFRDERLRTIIEEMVARFLELDLVAVKAQTHATLTGCRALLRWSALSGNEALVAAVRERFDLYTEKAWTEHYANYNWFGRPDWTEPCAIVDSLMVAMELWRRTEDTKYLEHAQHIYFNALGHAQRVNGGFGCDNCPGTHDEDDLYFKVFEAHWCCTMRGGEGLSRMTQYSMAQRGGEILLPFGLTGTYTHGAQKIEIASAYPFEPSLTVRTSGLKGGTVSVFVPGWMQDVRAQQAGGAEVKPTGSWLRLPLKDSNVAWEITGKFAEGSRGLLAATGSRKPRAVRYRGPLLLAGTPKGMEPIFDAYKAGTTEDKHSHRRLLWDAEAGIR